MPLLLAMAKILCRPSIKKGIKLGTWVYKLIVFPKPGD